MKYFWQIKLNNSGDIQEALSSISCWSSWPTLHEAIAKR